MWKSRYFMLGRITWTRTINDTIANCARFAKEICAIMNRYCNKDWGDMAADDKEANNKAITCNKRVVAAYETSEGRVYVITEWDRSRTTILFREEY